MSPTQPELPGLTRPAATGQHVALVTQLAAFVHDGVRQTLRPTPSREVSQSSRESSRGCDEPGRGQGGHGAPRLGAGRRVGELTRAPAMWAPPRAAGDDRCTPHGGCFQPPHTLPPLSRAVGKRRLEPEEALGGRGGATSGFTAVISKLSASRAEWLDGLSYSLCWFLLGGFHIL